MTDDIVLVTIDSLRADHCGWLGGDELTPFLDGLAADAVQFTSAYAPGPQTFMSVPASLTGSQLRVNEKPVTGADDRVQRIRSHLDEHALVSADLAAEGYTTVAFTANPWTSADVGFDQGFDTFVEVSREGGQIHDLFRETPLARPARLFDHWFHGDSWFSQWRTFYEDVVSTIDDVSGPVFAWIFLLDPHNPYLVPRQDRHESSTYGMYTGLFRANQLRSPGGTEHGTTIREQLDAKTLSRLHSAYRDCVRSVDTFAERLVGDLDSDTVFAVHSDHGEAFGEHGSFGHEPVLYEENIHVPLIVSGAGVTETVDQPVSTADIAPLLLEYARTGAVDPSAYTREYVISRTFDDSAISVRGDRWKYVRTDEGALYDMAGQGETADVSQQYPDVHDRLERRCDAFLEEMAVSETEESEIAESEEMREHLQSLGYL